MPELLRPRRAAIAVARARAVASAAALAAAPVAAAAVIPPGLDVRAEAFDYELPSSNGAGEIDTGAAGPLGRSAAANADRTVTTATATAFANYGYLSVSTAAVGTHTAGPGETSVSQALARASFRDEQVVVSAPGFTSADSTTFTAVFAVARDVAFTINPAASAPENRLVRGGFALDLIIDGAADLTPLGGYAGTWERTTPGGPTSAPTGLAPSMTPIAVEITVNYDTPFTIAAEATANLLASVENGSGVGIDATFGFDAAFRWLGIEGLPNGTDVSSPGDEDWTDSAVPTPGSGALALLAVAAAFRRSRPGASPRSHAAAPRARRSPAGPAGRPRAHSGSPAAAPTLGS